MKRRCFWTESSWTSGRIDKLGRACLRAVSVRYQRRKLAGTLHRSGRPALVCPISEPASGACVRDHGHGTHAGICHAGFSIRRRTAGTNRIRAARVHGWPWQGLAHRCGCRADRCRTRGIVAPPAHSAETRSPNPRVAPGTARGLAFRYPYRRHRAGCGASSGAQQSGGFRSYPCCHRNFSRTVSERRSAEPDPYATAGSLASMPFTLSMDEKPSCLPSA